MLIVNRHYGKSTKNQEKKIQEDLQNIMKYRSYNYFEENDEFTGINTGKTRDTYSRDRVTGKIVKTGEIDVQEQIQSAKPMLLKDMLDKYCTFEEIKASQDVKLQLEEVEDDLISIGSILDTVEEFKDKYELDPTMSAIDVMKYVNSKRIDLQKTVDSLNEMNEINSKQEENKDETSQSK